jgi:hypothetical protein
MPVGVIVLSEDQQPHQWQDMDPVESCRAERSPARDIVELREAGCRFETFRQRRRVGDPSTLPARTMPIMTSSSYPPLQVEEGALNRAERTSLALSH